MAKARQRRIENRRERRQGKEITQRWLIAAQSRRGMEDEEGRWINPAQRRQTKRMRLSNNTPPSNEVVVTDPPENEEVPATKKGTAPTDGRVMTNLLWQPIEEEWFESTKNIQPRGLWLLAILILPVITVVTLLISFLTAYKRISSAHL